MTNFGERYPDRREDLDFMVATGEVLAGAAMRLGLTEPGLKRWCRTYGHHDVLIRFEENEVPSTYWAKGRINV